MKIIYKHILILLIANLGFAQSSKTIFSEQGIAVNYNLSKTGTTTNTKTGTVFYEYKLVTTITNSSSKYWAYGPGCSLKVENISSNLITPSDEKFCKNNGRANVDHFCIEDNCNNFPQVSGVANPHQVICPNSTQKCELKFLHPDGLAGEPQISWWGWQFKEQIGDMTNKPQVVKQTNSSNKKVEPKANKKDGQILEDALNSNISNVAKIYIAFFESLGYKFINQVQCDGSTGNCFYFNGFHISMGDYLFPEINVEGVSFYFNSKLDYNKMIDKVKFPVKSEFKIKNENYQIYLDIE